jgi:hypothetical protein
MKKSIIFSLLIFLIYGKTTTQTLPETGISGVYEVMMGVNDAQYAKNYFADYGFSIVDSATLSAADALKIYGVNSALKSYRLQNGDIDSHGLLRLLVWENPLGNGVGYAVPETVGQRLAVMMTSDIYRLYDIYSYARQHKKTGKWLPTPPIADDLFGLNKAGDNDFFKRPILVKENAVYGEFFNHVFFQRNGYAIPGYGTINPNAVLKTSEFTHHDFMIKVKNMSELSYLSDILGLKAEGEPTVDGDWLAGPRTVFMMEGGYSHAYQGFVSPNNICGKLKFFMPQSNKPDFSDKQRVGELGITLHSFYTPKLQMVYDLALKYKMKPTVILKNEFGERSFVFKGPEGATWQIIEKMTTKHKPLTKLETKLTGN